MRSSLLLAILGGLVGLLAADPAATGPHRVIEEAYDFGQRPWADPTHDVGMDFTAQIYRPAELAAGPFPLLVILHGRHSVTYAVADGSVPYYPNWPPIAGQAALPNHRGYAWLARPLASQGCIVVSVRMNAFGSDDDRLANGGSEARARLLRAHLAWWRQLDAVGGGPFGTRYRGRIDWQRWGLVGHSRGGTGVAALHRLLRRDGADAGLQAVLLLAPSNLERQAFHGVPLAVLLGYLDGDVSDLGGVHHFDDQRTADPAPRYLCTLQGGNHNQFNSYWDPAVFAPGAKRDGPRKEWPGFGLDGAEQRRLAARWSLAFFRQHLLGDQRWDGILQGSEALDATLPAAAVQVVAYPADDERRRLNSTLTAASPVQGDAGAPATSDGPLAIDTVGGGAPSQDHLIDNDSRRFYQEPHHAGDPPGLRQLVLDWSERGGAWRATLPPAQRDWQQAAELRFRLGIDFDDPANVVDQPQDLSVELVDGSGAKQRLALAANDNQAAGAYPASTTDSWSHPKVLLHQARFPLARFDQVDLRDIRTLALITDRRDSGRVVVTDLLLWQPADDPLADIDAIALDVAAPAVDQRLQASIPGLPAAATVAWRWGDGATAETRRPRHRYDRAGSFVLSARVQLADQQRLLSRAVTVGADGAAAPTCSALADRSCARGAVCPAIPFTLSDADTPLDDLWLSLRSDDEALLPPAAMQIIGSGATRELRLTPTATLSGTATVTLRVDDGLQAVERSCQLTVTPAANDDHLPPLVNLILPGRFGAPEVELFAVAGETASLDAYVYQLDPSRTAADLSLNIASDRPELLPGSAVTVTRDPERDQRFLLAFPAPPAGSRVLLTCESDDGVAQATALLQVESMASANQPPVIDRQPWAETGTSRVGEPLVLELAASDPDGQPRPLTVWWNLVDRPADFQSQLPLWRVAGNGSSLAEQVTVSGLDVAGDYAFEAQISDGLAIVRSERLTVTVAPAVQQRLGHWPLDETRGWRLDQLRPGTPLQPVGAVGWARGRHGAAVDLGDGPAHLVSVADGLGTWACAEGGSWSLWLRPAALAGEQQLVGLGTTATAPWWLGLVAGRPTLRLRGEDGTAYELSAPAALPVERWSQLVATYDGASGRVALVVDGSLVAEDDSAPPRLSIVDAGLALGADEDGTAGFVGRVDDLRIFDAAIDSALIDAIRGLAEAPVLSWQSPATHYAQLPVGPVELGLTCWAADPSAVAIDLYRMDSPVDERRSTTHLASLSGDAANWTWTDAPAGAHRLLAVATLDGRRVWSQALDLFLDDHLALPLPRRRVLLQSGDPIWAWDHRDAAGRWQWASPWSRVVDLPPNEDHLFLPLPVLDD